MMRTKNINKQKGITLIALVITIIVLLILAGIAISMLSGENGILKKAADAKTETEKQAELENIKLAITAAMTNENHKIEKAVLEEELKKDFNNVSVEGEKDLIIEVDGVTYKVDSKGILNENAYAKKEETSTTGAVTLQNSSGEQLMGYKIEGNSKQNGDPKPESPVEIQSVGDLVTEGKYKDKYKIPVKITGKNLICVYDIY